MSDGTSWRVRAVGGHALWRAHGCAGSHPEGARHGLGVRHIGSVSLGGVFGELRLALAATEVAEWVAVEVLREDVLSSSMAREAGSKVVLPMPAHFYIGEPVDEASGAPIREEEVGRDEWGSLLRHLAGGGGGACLGAASGEDGRRGAEGSLLGAAWVPGQGADGGVHAALLAWSPPLRRELEEGAEGSPRPVEGERGEELTRSLFAGARGSDHIPLGGMAGSRVFAGHMLEFASRSMFRASGEAQG